MRDRGRRAPGIEYDIKIGLGIFIFGGIAEMAAAIAIAIGTVNWSLRLLLLLIVDCVKSKTIIDIISVYVDRNQSGKFSGCMLVCFHYCNEFKHAFFMCYSCCVRLLQLASFIFLNNVLGIMPTKYMRHKRTHSRVCI